MANQGKAAFINPETFNELVSTIALAKRNRERDIAILELGYRTGIRAKSLAEITVKQVIGADGQIKKRCVLNSSQVKGKRSHTLYLTHPKLIAALEAYLAVRPDVEVANLFVSERGNAYSPRGMSELVLNLMRKAGLDGTSCHSLRRSFCSNKLHQGADLVSLKALMGHRHINTTLIYCETDEKRLESLVSTGE